MTREDKLNRLMVRRNVLRGRGDKNIKCPGVLRKINRKIKNLEK